MATNLLFLALLPGIIIIIVILRKDKVESEPIGLIVKLLIFGAISCGPAIVLENWIDAYNPFIEAPTLGYSMYEAFVVAAFCEELCKYGLLRLGTWRNKAFDYRFDGIVYGVAVAVGFALLENIMYVSAGDLSTAISRGILAVPLHSFCGVFMGVFYGAAKKCSITGEHGASIGNHILALIVPMIIHGIYDTLAFLGSVEATLILLAFVAFLYIVAIRTVNKFSREDWSAAFYTNDYKLYHGN